MKRETLKRVLPHEKFEEQVILTHNGDVPPILNDDDDSESAVHEEKME